MIATDRMAVMHGVGALDLSPAVRGGAPALAALGDREGRCGWAPFFAALEARGEAVALEEGAARIVPRAGASAAPEHRRSALAEGREFLDALRGR